MRTPGRPRSNTTTHVPWIQKALHLDHISFDVGSWCDVPAVGRADRSGAQIDLLFDRDDQVISLCEIKYNTESFSIDKGYARELERKIDLRFLTMMRGCCSPQHKIVC